MLTLFNVITLTKPIWIFEFLYSDVKINAFYIWMSNYARQSLQYTWTLALLKWLTLNNATRIALGYDNFHGFEKDGGALDYSDVGDVQFDVGDVQFDVGDRIKMVTYSPLNMSLTPPTCHLHIIPPTSVTNINVVGALFHPIVPNIRNHILGFGFDFKFAFDWKKKVFELDFCDFLLIIDILKS